MPPRRSLAALLALLTLPLPAQQASPAQPQNPAQPPPDTAPITTLHTQARLVVLDVVVTDARGKPVRNLKASDFHLFEDGHSQTIASFTEHDASTASPAPATHPLPPNTFAPQPPATGNGAMTVIVLGNLDWQDAPFIRDQLKAFFRPVRRARPSPSSASTGKAFTSSKASPPTLPYFSPPSPADASSHH